jgi:NADH:ubiquinone oxidoreductase subunit 6 (subunit J)
MIAILLLIGGLILGSAIAAMLHPNLIYSALLLVGNWLGIAAFYLWAGAEFAAFAQVIVYVGAVSMIALFAVLLTRPRDPSPEAEHPARVRGAFAVLIAAATAGLLVGAVLATPLPSAPQGPTASVRDLGVALAGAHGPAVLITGILLTVALIGAITLASGDRSPTEARS